MEKFLMRNSEQPEEPVGGAKKMEGEKIAEQSASPETQRKYLYHFAHAAPGRPNTVLGKDLEDIREVFIIADSREKALEWGKHLSDAYIENLKKESGEFIGRGVVWVESENELRESKSAEHYSETPVLRYGEATNLYKIFKEQEEGKIDDVETKILEKKDGSMS